MAERPLECSECKRPIQVRYTELVGGGRTETVMCSECPVLQRRLHGAEPTPLEEGAGDEVTGLCCGNCDTTLESIRMGNPAGCSECYDVFDGVIADSLQRSGLLATPKHRLGGRGRYHVGRTPEEAVQISSSLRLLALNEALDETLSREDYEQAAWLRDQIRALTEESDEG